MPPPTIDFLPAAASPTSGPRSKVGFLGVEAISAVRAFHQTVPGYHITPLVSLDDLAQNLGLGAVFVKDEASRFGLGAFKGLGGIWAMARLLAARLAIEERPLSFPGLVRRATRESRSDLTFVTATAGNHGRGVAWAARRFGFRAVAVVPQGTDPLRIAAIRSEGARVEVCGEGFDAAVDAARRLARERGWLLLQDTAWDGYEEIPRWVMQGYATMVAESLEQIAAAGWDPPTHAFLQVGVGSFAAAATAALLVLGDPSCRVFTVEPDAYRALYASVEARRRRRVEGGPPTTMSCLACTETSSLAWPVLRQGCAGHFACSDDVAETGRRVLAEPRHGDPAIDSGPSGAAAVGLLVELARRDDLAATRRTIDLSPRSRVLLFSTEGSARRR